MDVTLVEIEFILNGAIVSYAIKRTDDLKHLFTTMRDFLQCQFCTDRNKFTIEGSPSHSPAQNSIGLECKIDLHVKSIRARNKIDNRHI